MDTLFNKISRVNKYPLPNTGFKTWDEEGVMVLDKFIPDDLIEAYKTERANLLGDKYYEGWKGPTPYLHVPTMRNLACYDLLNDLLEALLGNEAGLHLCLTGFKSTQRAWHQDSYLNPVGVNDNYIAAWFALDDINPAAGPFQYVPGSHRWPVIQHDLVLDYERARTGKDIDPVSWPTDTQDFVGDACQEEIDRRGAEIVSFTPKKGSVLLWHSQLIHRGSVPTDLSLERQALIAHYSSIHHRPDMFGVKRNETTGSRGYFFEFDHKLE